MGCLLTNSGSCEETVRTTENPMRLKLYAVAAFAVAFAGPATAQTYDPNYPVCMQYYGGSLGGNYIDCSFTSIPQCQASASGRPAECYVNPYYAGPPPAAKRRVRRERHPVY
jgi:uncharacterized protein DUF3551